MLSLDAVGNADIAGKKAMGTDALFWIASQSKPITAAALMMLVDEGKVRLDDLVENSSAGIQASDGLWWSKTRNTCAAQANCSIPSPSANLASATRAACRLARPWNSRPSTCCRCATRSGVAKRQRRRCSSSRTRKWQYSNAGINTAGRIIEVVSGMPYEDFLDKRLFGPLGMKDTTFWPNEEQLTRLAKSYKPNKEKNGLEEMPIMQRKYPLSDRKRQPIFSPAVCSPRRRTSAGSARWFVSGGVHQGKAASCPRTR